MSKEKKYISYGLTCQKMIDDHLADNHSFFVLQYGVMNNTLILFKEFQAGSEI